MRRYGFPMSWSRLLYFVARFAELAVIMAICFLVIPHKHENLCGFLSGWVALWSAVYLMERVFLQWRTRVSASAQQ